MEQLLHPGRAEGPLGPRDGPQGPDPGSDGVRGGCPQVCGRMVSPYCSWTIWDGPQPGIKASLECWEREGEVPEVPRDQVEQSGAFDRQVAVSQGLDCGPGSNQGGDKGLQAAPGVGGGGQGDAAGGGPGLRGPSMCR